MKRTRLHPEHVIGVLLGLLIGAYCMHEGMQSFQRPIPSEVYPQ